MLLILLIPVKNEKLTWISSYIEISDKRHHNAILSAIRLIQILKQNFHMVVFQSSIPSEEVHHLIDWGFFVTLKKSSCGLHTYF